MNQVFEKVAQRLSDRVPELKWIDWEIGQLNADSESFPLQFPATLIDIESVEWSNVMRNLQEGVASVAVRIVFGIWKDFSSYNPDYTETAQQLELVNKVQAALQGFRGEHFSEMNRSKSTTEYREDGYKAVTLYYQTTVTDSNGMPNYTTTYVQDISVKTDAS